MAAFKKTKFNGTNDQDSVVGGAGKDVINGKGGADLLHGYDGNDKLDGGNGTDLLIDGGGKDKLKGGGGSDLFRLHADGQKDTILDFTVGTDLLDLRAMGVSSMQDMSFSDGKKGTTITVDGEKTFLKGVSSSDLSADDFVFTKRETSTFDDVTAAQISGGEETDSVEFHDYDYNYDNLVWYNAVLFNENKIGYTGSESGYIAVSGSQAIYNDSGETLEISGEYTDYFGVTIPDLMDFESAIINSAWRDDLMVAVTGFVGDKRVGTQLIEVDRDDPQEVFFDDNIFDAVTRVEIIGFGGDRADNSLHSWTQIVIDDLVVL